MSPFFVSVIAGVILALACLMNLVYYNIREKEIDAEKRQKNDKSIYLVNILMSAAGMLLIIVSILTGN